MLLLYQPLKFNKTMERIATFQEIKEGNIIYLQCEGNGLIVTTYQDSLDSALTATSQHHDKWCAFRFIEWDSTNQIYQIESVGHHTRISAIGNGWPLFPRIEDFNWAKFKIKPSTNNRSINIQSAHPIANSSWVSAVQSDHPNVKIIRICEATPIEGWSDFTPYLNS